MAFASSLSPFSLPHPPPLSHSRRPKNWVVYSAVVWRSHKSRLPDPMPAWQDAAYPSEKLGGPSVRWKMGGGGGGERKGTAYLAVTPLGISVTREPAVSSPPSLSLGRKRTGGGELRISIRTTVEALSWSGKKKGMGSDVWEW